MPYIDVTSMPETFRRAGLSFSRKPRRISVDDKTLKALAGEANLKVIVLKEEKKAAAKKAATPGKSKAKSEPAAKVTEPAAGISDPAANAPEKAQGDS